MKHHTAILQDLAYTKSHFVHGLSSDVRAMINSYINIIHSQLFGYTNEGTEFTTFGLLWIGPIFR